MFAQDTATTPDPVIVETMDQTVVEPIEVEEPMADAVEVVEEMVEEAAPAAPTLEDIAASSPALDVRLNNEGEVDAMVMLSDVLFAFGNATLEAAAIEVLSGVADMLEGVPALEITGHTDSIGAQRDNLALGQRRADAVRDWLVANTGLAADAITATGMGEADPIAPNTSEDGTDNPEGRAMNRRVEFTLPDAQ